VSKFKKRDKSASANRINRNFFYVTLILLIVGLVFVADISAPQALNEFDDKFYFFKSQLGASGVGLLLMFIFSKINYNFWKKLATPLFFISVFLLILVLIPEIGLKVYGARRWISLFGFNFQPVEIVKLTLALYLAKVASSDKKDIAYFFPLGLVAGLVMLQPDLGSTLVVTTIGMVQIFVSGMSLIHFFGTILAGLIAVILLIVISPYRRDRLFTFLSVTSDPLGKDYHIRQILLAIGSGGIFGLGIGQSKQKYLFLPEAATDSIFAAIAEEVGLIGSILIIGIFVYFVYQVFKIALSSPDTFSKVFASGIGAWIGGQVFLNMASMTALTPLTGIPLPFFSHGGTSLVMILSACGILLNISRYEAKKITSNR
jgi:cell division protein FtsW